MGEGGEEVIASLPGTPAVKSRASSLPNMNGAKFPTKGSFQSSTKSGKTKLPSLGSYEQEVKHAIFVVQEEFAEVAKDLQQTENNDIFPPAPQTETKTNENTEVDPYANDFEETAKFEEPETKQKEEGEDNCYQEDFD